jgi:hypothetical protein
MLSPPMENDVMQFIPSIAEEILLGESCTLDFYNTLHIET